MPVFLDNRLFQVGETINGLWQITDLRQQRENEEKLLRVLRRLEAQKIARMGDFEWIENSGELRISA